MAFTMNEKKNSVYLLAQLKLDASNLNRILPSTHQHFPWRAHATFHGTINL